MFVKVFDDKLASVLNEGGFSYIEEKINGDTVYLFEESDELNKALDGLVTETEFQETVIIRDSSVSF
jgi:hypothetical protein